MGPSIDGHAIVGSKMYALQRERRHGGGENKLLCFDLATKAACEGQPFAVEAETAPSRCTHG